MRNSRYDDDPSGYDTLRDCWLNRRRRDFIAVVLMDATGGQKVLEVGSGTGALLQDLGGAFPGHVFHGLEPLPGYVAFSRERVTATNVRFFEGTAERANQVLTDRYTRLLSNDVLHHLESEEQALKALSDVAAPGARWLAIEPNCWNPYAWLGQTLKPGERNFRPRQFCRLAQARGWSVRNKGTVFLIPPFIRRAPGWMEALERLFERVPVLGGGVWLELEKEG